MPETYTDLGPLNPVVVAPANVGIPAGLMFTSPLPVMLKIDELVAFVELATLKSMLV